MDLKSTIRVIEGFPKEGISFKDITTLLKDKDAFKCAIDELEKNIEGLGAEYIVGPEARGFMLGCALSYKMDLGFIPVRKKGKLPAETVSFSYEKEYGTDTIEIHKDAIKPGTKVVVIDDLLATGGTVEAVKNLLEKMGAEIVAFEFLIELTDLKGRDKLDGYKVDSLITYNV